MSVRILPIDPDDAEAIAAFHRIYEQVGMTDNPEGFIGTRASEIATVLRAPTERFSFSAFLGYVGDAPVASGWCAADEKDDPRLVHLSPRVLPEHRRHGYGTTMLDHLEAHAAGLGRTLFHGQAVWTPAAGPDGAGSAASRLAASHGWELALSNARLKLAIPVAAERLEALLGERSERRRGYTVRAWSGPIPEALLADWAQLEAIFSQDAPRGALAAHTQTASTAAIRDDERRLVESGEVKFNAVALSPAGELVAASEVVVRLAGSGPGLPGRQWGTLVRADHRGRGLGAAVKVAVLRLLEQERPDVRSIVTENAHSNEYMLALNLALGYAPFMYAGVFQKHAGQERPLPLQ